jgi:hypothetical protein
MVRALVCTLMLVGPLLVAHAATYYVAPDGSENGDGSEQHPWPTPQYALSRVTGGNTIIVRPGTYRGGVQLRPEHTGTPEQPTVLKSEDKWKAVIIGSETHCIWTEPGCEYTIIDGFQVFGARHDGVKLCGNNCTVRNCWAHNNVAMGLASHNTSGNTFDSNLVEYNGSHVQFHHGVYVGGSHHTITRNIVRHNAGWGLHLYAEIRDSLIALNLVHGHRYRTGILVACPEGGGGNRIIGNTVVDNADALDVRRGRGEVIANNILCSRYDPIILRDPVGEITLGPNLCEPASANQGPEGITGDPKFIDTVRGVYWLREDSPARGKGSAQYLLATDFWGRPPDATVPPALGCFPYVEALTKPQAREKWYWEWPYEFYHSQEMGVPDLWDVVEG